MTDAQLTTGGGGVLGMIGEELNSEHNPSALLCNVDPLMMFQNKTKDLCQQIHDSTGKKRIKECFMRDVEFTNESFIIKALKCLPNCGKHSGNRWDHFTEFIKPKENQLILLKDHCFNRPNDCCLTVFYHLDDSAWYLEKYSSITNGILILGRSFTDMEILKSIFAAISLLGIHILRLFHKLIIS